MSDMSQTFQTKLFQLNWKSIIMYLIKLDFNIPPIPVIYFCWIETFSCIILHNLIDNRLYINLAGRSLKIHISQTKKSALPILVMCTV